MIQISNLSVFYGGKKEKVKAVGPINFKCNDNDICAIIGPSGCGKTTLLNVLSGVNKDYEGEVLLNDEKLNPHLHKIGFIPQDFGLLPWKTVEENCLLPFKIKGEKIDKDILDKMDSILKRLNIDSLRKKHPNKLSGGQRQRVSIARSFLMNPDLLLMDEAFSALDAIIKEEAEELFLDVWSSNKISTFFVTHSIDEAIYMGKKIIIMSNTPGVISEVIENELFNNKNYKEDIRYLKLFSRIKNLIKKEWDNK
ncbi:nitrate/sulfonate/bicarbonate ABC transporter ATP-binding protein [Clostridium baratii]|uniref:ABC transporter ATP-binding protein n=1 Tax=Clostridium baratii TaxID=1561 RepID=UPI0009A37826|nr:ABC transporter ATP-binding protein [Clostridium baratii]OPF52378.1 nitrate/sulfonate/bicarbonate ABC transporter ATP-binding protein [Clostridium baratii]OPF55828.1 nitrate/sulfonate/bicarbonate ABC transporter ATP-binding protein [Clostridium baratii]OPF56792.1 nitrate/sulfonate/bicarbonate ABC transporter ATP-binding protein [Clostridium baratii]OPF59791.1 nitrate/sulfonate/bicarbonate ABC transporter ATP-binding protein [Clostridium baratii]